MSGIEILYIVYAVILLIGGIVGYVKAKSSPSLIGGIASAILALIAALLTPEHAAAGLGLGLLTGLLVGILFLRRYATTKKPMPAIPIIVLSAIVFLVSVFYLFHHG